MKRFLILLLALTALVFIVSCNETPNDTGDNIDNEITETTGSVNTGTNETLGADPEKEITVICECENCNKKTIDSATAIIIAQTNFLMIKKSDDLYDIWTFYNFTIEQEDHFIVKDLLAKSSRLDSDVNYDDYWLVYVNDDYITKDPSSRPNAAKGGSVHLYVIDKYTGEIADLILDVGE